jgi:hypothetical protein
MGYMSILESALQCIRRSRLQGRTSAVMRGANLSSLYSFLAKRLIMTVIVKFSLIYLVIFKG